MRRLRALTILALAVPAALAGCTARPAPERPAIVPPITVVPFESVRNQVLVPIRIAGEGPFSFILDTGANTSVIDLGLARRLGLPVDTAGAGEAAGAGAGSVSTYYPATLRGLRMGDVAIEDLPGIASELLARIAAGLGTPVHGILGYDFLRDRAVQIDYPARVVRLLPDGPAAGVGDGEASLRVPLVFRPNDVVPLIAVRVNGREIPVSLDTGSSRALEIFATAVGDLGLQEVYAGAEVVVLEGARGTFEARKATLDSIGLGPFVMTGVETEFSPPRFSEGRLGNMGGGVLRHFVLTLDYRRGEITLARPDDRVVIGALTAPPAAAGSH